MLLRRRVSGLALFCLLAAAAPAIAKEKVLKEVVIIATVPAGTGDVFITGSDKMFGPWKPKGSKMYAEGNKRYFKMEAKDGYRLEYKFTLGTWQQEEVDENLRPVPNHELRLGEKDIVEHTILRFGVS